LLLVGAIGLLLPGSAALLNDELFTLMPYFALGIAFLLGIFFAQSRVSLLSLFSSTTVILLHATSGGSADFRPAAVLLAATTLPILALSLCVKPERGVLTPFGTRRFVCVGLIAALACALPHFPGLNTWLASFPLGRPLSALIQIPGGACIALAATAPFLWRRREHEAPFLGKLIGSAVVLFFVGLDFALSANPQRGTCGFLLFATASGATLSWAVLANAWWHANVDELTQLPGRRLLKHHFRCLHEPYALAVVDIDHFKKVNDTYGHDTGDQVLRFLAAQLGKTNAGRAYRQGGEEFVIVSETCEFEAFVERLEDLKRSVEQSQFVLRDERRPKRKPKEGQVPAARKKTIPLTVSIGAACHGKRCPLPQDVLEAADRALYAAKENGRNQVRRAK